MSATESIGPLGTANREVWGSQDVVADFARSEGWTDPGERAAVLSLAPLVRGSAMLDLGMGGGRTTTWALLLTDDYVGVDITSEMVAAARRRHPRVDFLVGDARDLSIFRDGQFGFVMFSFNGLDAVGHDDRGIVLREMSRVLKPGGYALLSTCNRDSPSFLSTPWRRGRAAPADTRVPRPAAESPTRSERLQHLANRAVRLATDPTLPFRRAASWRKLNRLREDHATWSIAPLDAHAFRLLVHWTTLSAACSELDAAGLAVTQVFRSDTGSAVEKADWHRPRAVRCDFFHLVAKRTRPGD